jgi:CRP-like cAMP-binding protein
VFPWDPLGAARAGGSGERRSASVRAVGGRVRVASVPHARARDFLRQHPEAKQALAEMSWARQSETIVLEALLRLASIRGDLEAAAAAAAGGGRGGGGGGGPPP